MFLDGRALERKFKKAKDATETPLPDGLTMSDVDVFSRVLSCTSLSEVEDISNETIASLFDKIFPFAELMNVSNVITSDRMEKGMREVRGLCPRRII